ncbi:hypothetical protein D7S44_13115 [Pantoea piersonii]|nr:hypothetical protein D7S44_13115 [Pantoea piersonii]
MTTDIAKFIEDKNGYLKKILQNTKIRRWVLVVPRHVSKHLVVHAANKESEVIAAGLPYVDNEDFKVLIWDRETLKNEESDLINRGMRILKIDIPEVSSEEIESLKQSESEFVNNISRKLRKLRDNDTQVTNAASQLLNNIVSYKNTMTDLKENYPSLHEEITKGIFNREQELDLDVFSTDITPPLKQIELLKNNLSETSNLHKDNLKCIATGVVGDWLMRCNLDF